MITAYTKVDGRILDRRLAPGDPIPEQVVWFDLMQPTVDERESLGAALGVDLPTREEMREIEASSQLYVEDDGIYLTTPLLSKTETAHPQQGEVTFVLTRQHLVTIRYTDPRSFPIFAYRATKQPSLLATPEDGLLGLLDSIIDRFADVLELLASKINTLSSRIFDDSMEPARSSAQKKSGELQEVLRSVGRAGELNHKVRTNLAGLDRLVTFLGPLTTARLNKDQKNSLKTLSRDLRSLQQQAGFLAQEVNFLLDATLGLINIEQTNIIKIFSVAAVAFLPPTLIASIYGMNFRYMPELDFFWSYPIALVVMVVSGILPILYFKRKGWL